MEAGGSLTEGRGGDDRREGVEGRRGLGLSVVVGVCIGKVRLCSGGVVGTLSGLSGRSLLGLSGRLGATVMVVN